MSYTLMNFNIPRNLKERFDRVTDVKHVSKTSVLNVFIAEYCRNELRNIEADEKLQNLMIDSKGSKTPMQEEDESHSLEGWVPPAIPSLDDDYDWEERFRL